MSLINKMAKIQSNGGDYGGAGMVIPPRMIGPPVAIGTGGGYGGGGGRAITNARMTGPPMFVGDPGIFSFLGKAAKTVGGFIGGAAGMATGIVSKLGIPVVSGVAGMVSQFVGRGAIPGASTQPAPLAFQIPGPIPPAPAYAPGGVITPYGAATVGTAFAGAAPQIAGAVPATGSVGGYHLNKSSYFLMDGTFIPAGTKWVKNRRRNPGNMRALSRSLSRITSAKKMTQALGRITIRKKC